MRNIEVKKLAGIDYIEAGNLTSARTIVLFHGFGADMYDLFQLHEVIGTRSPYRWIFPNGTLEIPMGFYSGRAWFQIDIPQFERLSRSGELRKRCPPGMPEARQKVEKFLKALNLDFSQTYLGGFSQGAMITTDLILQTDITPKGAILLSGTLVYEDVWKEKAKQKALRFFQSHGKSDPMLPYELAVALNEMLTDSGWDGNFVEFNGGHEIPMKVLQQLSSFID